MKATTATTNNSVIPYRLPTNVAKNAKRGSLVAARRTTSYRNQKPQDIIHNRKYKNRKGLYTIRHLMTHI